MHTLHNKNSIPHSCVQRQVFGMLFLLFLGWATAAQAQCTDGFVGSGLQLEWQGNRSKFVLGGGQAQVLAGSGAAGLARECAPPQQAQWQLDFMMPAADAGAELRFWFCADTVVLGQVRQGGYMRVVPGKHIALVGVGTAGHTVLDSAALPAGGSGPCTLIAEQDTLANTTFVLRDRANTVVYYQTGWSNLPTQLPFVGIWAASTAQTGWAIDSFACTWGNGPAMAQATIRLSEVNPCPGAGGALPNAEWIEITNASPDSASTQGMAVVVGTHQATLPKAVLAPGAFALLCHPQDSAAMAPFGRVLPLALPLLPNSGGTVALRNAHGQAGLALHYMPGAWGLGGIANGSGSPRTLECQDVAFAGNPALNWLPCTAPQGGTPGQPNATARTITDERGPRLCGVLVQDAQTVQLAFDEPLGLLPGEDAFALVAANGQRVPPVQVVPAGATAERITLRWAAPLQGQTAYTLAFARLADLCGNSTAGSTVLALPQPPQPGQVVVNELLPTPLPGGTPFLEVRNTGASYIDVGQVLFAAAATGAAPASMFAEAGFLLAPGALAAFAQDTALVLPCYVRGSGQNVWAVAALPRWPASGTAQLLAAGTGEVLFSHAYAAPGHAGQAVEWGDSAAGFVPCLPLVQATPGLPNSRSTLHAGNGWCSLRNRVLHTVQSGSPQAVGVLLDLPGPHTATLEVFAQDGAPIARPYYKAPVAALDVLSWDGRTAAGRDALPGAYILQVTAALPDGSTEKRMRMAIVVAE